MPADADALDLLRAAAEELHKHWFSPGAWPGEDDRNNDGAIELTKRIEAFLEGQD